MGTCVLDSIVQGNTRGIQEKGTGSRPLSPEHRFKDWPFPWSRVPEGKWGCGSR